MKVYQITLVNALILIILGLWGYFDSNSFTALIPVIAGVILVLLYSSNRRGNTLILNITIALTVLLIGGLIKPLTGAIQRQDNASLIRVGIMIISSLVALYYYLKKYSGRKKIL